MRVDRFAIERAVYAIDKTDAGVELVRVLLQVWGLFQLDACGLDWKAQFRCGAD